MEETASPVFKIKKRTKKATPTRSNAAAETFADTDEGNVAVVRARPKGPGHSSTRAPSKPRMSFEASTADVSPSEPVPPLRKTLLRQPLNLPSNETSEAPSASLYSSEALAQLKATTVSRQPSGELALPADATDPDGGSDAHIPTSNAIAAAKIRREQARKAGIQADDNGFIPLDVGFANKTGESRFVREEDELGSGDEEMAEFTGAHERVALGSKARKRSELDRKAGIKEMIDDVEDDHAEQDVEAMEWEVAQLRRGGKLGDEPATGPMGYQPAPIPATSTIPTMAQINGRLQNSLADLQVSHDANDAIVKSSKQEVQDLDQQETDLRNQVERSSRKLEWFETLRDWVEEVAAFLDAKQPALENIEKEDRSIQKERLDIIARRRYQDDADDLALFTGARISTDYEPPSTEDADQVVDANEQQQQLAPESSSRQARRSARTTRRTLSAVLASKEDGYATDDELPPEDSEDLLLALTRMQRSIETLFEDVASQEYKDPEVGVLPRFREWRALHEEEYRKSWGGLVLVNVFEFWARAELLNWNPFQIPQLPIKSKGFEDFRWHQLLTDYSHHQMTDGSDEENAVAALVADVVIPRFKALLPAYDVYSSAATTKALAVVEEISYCVDTKGQKYEAMLQAVLRQIANAIHKVQTQLLPHVDAVTTPLHSLDISAITARHRYALRLTKLATCALRWRRLAKGIAFPAGLGQGESLDLVVAVELVGKCLLPVLEAGWHSGEQELAERVLSLFARCTDILPEEYGLTQCHSVYGTLDSCAFVVHSPSLPQKSVLSPPKMNFRKRIGSTSALQEAHAEELPDRPYGHQNGSKMLLPDLKAFNNLHQFELSASLLLGKENPAWRLLSSFADDGLSYKASLTATSFIRFIPRVLQQVAYVDASANFLGQQVASPFFLAPVGDLGLYHNEAELGLVQAAAQCGVPLCLASKTTKPLKDIFAERDKLSVQGKGLATLWYQIYMLADRQLTKTLIKEAVDGGVSALVLTVDQPCQGNRETSPDNMNKSLIASSRDGPSPFIDADAVSMPTDRSIKHLIAGQTWSDIAFCRKYSGNAKLIVKGILSVKDALKCRDKGADGIILSNHGGLQLDHAPPALAVLVEMRQQAPELLQDPKFEVYIDGGIRRGSDIVKAICLGAKGVGLGRPFIFSLVCYGTKGCIKACDILKEEVERTLRLIGVPKVVDLNTSRIELLDGLLGRKI